MSDTNRQIDIFGTESRAAIEAALPAYLPARRWFGGKARTIRSVEIEEAIPFSGDPPRYYLTLIRVSYVEGDPQTYVIPLTFAAGERAEEVRRETPQAVLVEVSGGAEGIIYDTSWDREFTLALLEAIAAGRRFGGDTGEVVAWPMPTEGSGSVNTEGLMDLEPSVVKSEQSNTSVIYGDRYILKLFRRLEAGTSPELEVGRFLAEKRFASTPPLDGAIEYHRQRGEPITMAVLQGFVPNKGDAWRYTLSRLADYFQSNWEAAGGEDLLPRSGHLLATLEEEVPTPVRKAAGSYLEQAALLGRRTAEMHITLASDPSDPAFAPQPFDDDYRRSTYEAMRDLTVDAFELLGDNIDKLQEAAREEGRAVTERQDEIMARFRPLVDGEISAVRTRCHGDYHLGQVLYTGDDFVIIDFEGEPVRSLEERRRKHSPLKDVGGMLRSFHYASASALQDQMSNYLGSWGNVQDLEKCADAWHHWVSAAYLKEYLAVASSGSFLPQSPEELKVLLDAYMLEKAVYELIYELNNRPAWVRIPLQGIKEIMGF